MTGATIKKILVPTDFSECSRHAMDQALDLAVALNAEIVLLHASEVPQGLPRDAQIQAEGRGWHVSEYLESTALKELTAAAQELEARGARVTVRAGIGTPSEVIGNVARDVGADLVVVGTHGRTGIRRALLGSVAERVLRHSRVPVLTVRTPGDDDVLPEAEADMRAELDG